MKHLFLTLSLLVWLTASAQFKTIQNIPYSDDKDSYARERCKLDIYYNPETPKDSLLPVVVWFHGGGLTGGEKFIPDELKESGFVVIAPNYRLLPKSTIDQTIDDAAAAVAWTFKNAENYGGDPAKVFVSGHSAGGYLSSMIGFNKNYLNKYGIDADSIAGLFPYSGQAITHFAIRKDKGIGELTPTIDEYSPMFHIRKDAPPYIIITGDADMELFGRYEENLYLWRMLKLMGHPDVKIFKLDGYDHGAMAVPAHHIMKNEIRRLLNK